MQKEIQELKKELEHPHNTRTSKKHIRINYPKIYSYIQSNIIYESQTFSGYLYTIIHDINYPKCEICGNYKKFISFKRGFLKYCDKKCEKHFFKLNNYPNYKFKKVNQDKDIEIYYNGYFLKTITLKKFNTLIENKVDVFIEEKSKEIITNKIIPRDKSFYKNKLKEILYKRKYFGDEYFLNFYPYTYNLVREYSKNYKDIKLRDRIFLFLNDLKPECKICGSKDVIRKGEIKKYCKKCNYKISSKKRSIKKKHNYWKEYLEKNFYLPNKDFQLFVGDKNIRLKNYCKHKRNIIISKEKIKRYKQIKIKFLCIECLKNFIVNNYEVNNKKVKNNWMNIKKMNEQKILEYDYEIWNSMYKNSKKFRNCDFYESKYMIKYDYKKRPKCIICNNEALFSKEKYGYLYHCKKHLHSYNSSLEEKEIYDFIKNNYNGEILQNYRNFENKELDIYVPEKKLGIEFNGLYWHSDIFIHKDKHQEKYNFFKARGIQLLTIWEDDWNFKKDIIKNILLNKLNLIQRKINARNCYIKEINYKESKKFLEENHLQSYVPDKIRLGLFYNNELVSLMTFGKRRKILGQKSKEENYELLRFCNKKFVTVRGGASKLFNYFIKKHKPLNIISYANLDISNGNLYEQLGLKKVEITKPNYWWAKNGIKYHRSNFMKHHLVKEGYDKSKTEDQIMRERGFWKIHGTGNIKYVNIGSLYTGNKKRD